MAMALLEQLRRARIREEVAGAYGPAEGDATLERALWLLLTARAADLAELWRGRPMPVEGLLSAEGFGEQRRAHGSVSLEHGPCLRYRILFAAATGGLLRLEARRRLSLRGLPPDITVLRGRIVDARGRAVARALLRFDPRRQLRLDFGRGIARTDEVTPSSWR
jgi:hypothetical protein